MYYYNDELVVKITQCSNTSRTNKSKTFKGQAIIYNNKNKKYTLNELLKSNSSWKRQYITHYQCINLNFKKITNTK